MIKVLLLTTLSLQNFLLLLTTLSLQILLLPTLKLMIKVFITTNFEIDDQSFYYYQL